MLLSVDNKSNNKNIMPTPQEASIKKSQGYKFYNSDTGDWVK